MSTVKSKQLQVGTSATSTDNFTIYQPATPDGTLRIGVGNADSPTEVARFDSIPSYFARAWVNFDGTGTVAIRESKNVSSITDNGTGYYTINFSTDMEDANYSAFASPNNGDDTGDALRTVKTSYYTTSSVSCTCNTQGSTRVIQDYPTVNIVIFR